MKRALLHHTLNRRDTSARLVALALVATAAAVTMFPELAMAGMQLKSGQTIGQVSTNVTTSLSGAARVVTALCYLGAVAMGFIGALKWKAYGDQPDRTPLKVPLMYWGVAVILAAIPEFLGTGIATLWGGGAQLVPTM